MEEDQIVSNILIDDIYTCRYRSGILSLAGNCNRREYGTKYSTRIISDATCYNIDTYYYRIDT